MKAYKILTECLWEIGSNVTLKECWQHVQLRKAIHIFAVQGWAWPIFHLPINLLESQVGRSQGWLLDKAGQSFLGRLLILFMSGLTPFAPKPDHELDGNSFWK